MGVHGLTHCLEHTRAGGREAHPNTTCTLQAERIANDAALQAKFGRRRPLVGLPGDVKQNEKNFDEGGKWIEDWKLKPAGIPVDKCMKIVLTQIIRKDAHFVNGQERTVERFEAKRRWWRVEGHDIDAAAVGDHDVDGHGEQERTMLSASDRLCEHSCTRRRAESSSTSPCGLTAASCPPLHTLMAAPQRAPRLSETPACAAAHGSKCPLGRNGAIVEVDLRVKHIRSTGKEKQHARTSIAPGRVKEAFGARVLCA